MDGDLSGGRAPGAKIPVLRLVQHAYYEVIARRRALVETGGLWLVVPWVLHTLDGPFGLLLGDLALTAGFAAIAVAWHRAILLNEPLPARFAPVNAHVARYLGLSVIVIMLALLPSLMLGLVLAGSMAGGEEGQGPGTGWVLALLLGAILSLLAAMRLQLVFPAAALGDRRVGFAAAWAASQGNTLRLLAGVLLVSLPAAVMGAVLAQVLAALSELTGSLVLGWLAGLAPIAGAWIQAPLLATFLSYVYFHLRPGGTMPASYGAPGSR